MIDLHTHILPGVDDGAANIEEAVELAHQGYEDGISVICATPHILGAADQNLEDLLVSRTESLRNAILEAGVGVQLLLGSEIYIRPDLLAVTALRFGTLNGTGKYVLIEFPVTGIPPQTGELVSQLVLEGVRPIIAHPERNASLRGDLGGLVKLVEAGALVQINAGCLTGRSGSRVQAIAEAMLSANLVHFLSSDAHDVGSRPLRLSEAVRAASQLIGEAPARALVEYNPTKVIAGEPIAVAPPIAAPRCDRKSLRSLLRRVVG